MTAARLGWLVSYPKSGNTWLRMMLSSLMKDGEPVDINGNIEGRIASFAEMDELLGIDASELTESEIAAAQPALHQALTTTTSRTPLLRKVHDRFWRTPSGAAAFPPDASCGAVYLVRDPRDIAVSYSRHSGTTIDRIIDSMADDGALLGSSPIRAKAQLRQPVGSWSGHVRSWLEQDEIPVLTLRYEDMLGAPGASLAAAAAHLGIGATFARVEAAVAATRFDILSAQEKAYGFRERHLKATTPFFREGQSGDWRIWLSSEQADRLIDHHGAVMKQLGYLPQD